jgi:amino acid transporter
MNATRATKARRTLAVASWTLLALVLIGFMISAPMIEQWLDALPKDGLLHFGVSRLPLLAGAAAIAAWISALVHAASEDPPRRLPRWGLVVILIVGNFVASFFYYFLWARRRPERSLA